MACIDYIRESGGIEYEFLVSLSKSDGGAIMAVSMDSLLQKEWRDGEIVTLPTFSVVEGDCFEIDEDYRNYQNAVIALEEEALTAAEANRLFLKRTASGGRIL